MLNQTPTITITNDDRLLPAKDACTIQGDKFRGLTTIMAFKIFAAATILALYRHLSAVEHIQHTSSATSIDQLSQQTQVITACIGLGSTSKRSTRNWTIEPILSCSPRHRSTTTPYANKPNITPLSFKTLGPSRTPSSSQSDHPVSVPTLRGTRRGTHGGEPHCWCSPRTYCPCRI